MRRRQRRRQVANPFFSWRDAQRTSNWLRRWDALRLEGSAPPRLLRQRADAQRMDLCDSNKCFQPQAFACAAIAKFFARTSALTQTRLLDPVSTVRVGY